MSDKHSSNSAKPTQEISRFPTKLARFISFDGGVISQGKLQRPDRYRYWRPNTIDIALIPRGAGLSYAAASFSQGGISTEHSSFNRILDFDTQTNMVEVETGIELSTLYDFLAKHGLYLPIQPGHGRITVGGCIAADVHGKNHAKDGTFINQVVSLTLFHPDQGIVEISPEIEPELFRLTCGGYGLTGNILRAKLRASVIPSHIIEINAVPLKNISSGMTEFTKKAFDFDFAYSWHNFIAKGTRFGHGYAFFAQFLHGNQNSNKLKVRGGSVSTPQLSADGRALWRLPMLNYSTTQGLNILYQIQQATKGQVRHATLRDALFPIHATQFYFKLFGTSGFHEYQVVIPTEHIANYFEAIQDYLNRSPIAITLASAKFFHGKQDLLRFTGNGICFALNFPRNKESVPFLVFLDKLVISLNGIPNIIKDSRLPRSVVEACYPEIELFRNLLNTFDPKRRFRSELSERLGL